MIPRTILTLVLSMSLLAHAESVLPIKPRSAGNQAIEQRGIVADNAEIQGITIINDQIWIDGETVPANLQRFKSKRGITYRIIRHSKKIEVYPE